VRPGCRPTIVVHFGVERPHIDINLEAIVRAKESRIFLVDK
jgi:hypothetical protein